MSAEEKLAAFSGFSTFCSFCEPHVFEGTVAGLFWKIPMKSLLIVNYIRIRQSFPSFQFLQRLYFHSEVTCIFTKPAGNGLKLSNILPLPEDCKLQQTNKTHCFLNEDMVLFQVSLGVGFASNRDKIEQQIEAVDFFHMEEIWWWEDLDLGALCVPFHSAALLLFKPQFLSSILPPNQRWLLPYRSHPGRDDRWQGYNLTVSIL